MTHLLLIMIYLAFISLGLPDALLGAAWPTMQPEFGVPLSFAGIVSMIIAVGTIVSSLLSDRLTRKWGTGLVTACSVALTAIALIGFSVSRSFLLLCLWAVPYGLGAGSVDASLNNYVALHYKSRHMSWLHCMWGIGATLGPYVMGYVLTGGGIWNDGYRYIGLAQVLLTAVLLCSLPMWKKSERGTGEAETHLTDDLSEQPSERPMKLSEVLRIPGAKEVMLCFFCYCTVEQTANLWASSYLTIYRGVEPQTAARFAGLFFIGITVGRALCGFLTFKLQDAQMVRLGQVVIALGIVALLLPAPRIVSLVGLIIIGFGCAPIYPSLIHSTPSHFGASRSQAVIGVQMASAYAGTCLMPPLFGLIANHITVALLPIYLLLALVVMAWMHVLLMKRAPVQDKNR